MPGDSKENHHNVPVSAGHTGNPAYPGWLYRAGTDFKQPEAEVEQHWLETDAPAIQTGDTSASDWWTVFNDPVLNTLVQQANEQNLPLQEAAGSLRRVGLSEYQPNFNPALDDSYWTANTGFNASWEMDFWGKFRRGVESASTSLGTQVAAYDSVLSIV